VDGVKDSWARSKRILDLGDLTNVTACRRGFVDSSILVVPSVSFIL